MYAHHIEFGFLCGYGGQPVFRDMDSLHDEKSNTTPFAFLTAKNDAINCLFRSCIQTYRMINCRGANLSYECLTRQNTPLKLFSLLRNLLSFVYRNEPIRHMKSHITLLVIFTLSLVACSDSEKPISPPATTVNNSPIVDSVPIDDYQKDLFSADNATFISGNELVLPGGTASISEYLYLTNNSCFYRAKATSPDTNQVILSLVDVSCADSLIEFSSENSPSNYLMEIDSSGDDQKIRIPKHHRLNIPEWSQAVASRLL